jgi:hypothetical protein
MTNYSSNLETVHAWANSLSNDGNNSNHSINFKGNVVYSYSTPMAEFIAGSNVVLFNTEKYSVTTSSHQSIIRGAIPYSFEIIEVPFGSKGCNNSLSHSSNHSSNFEAWENKLVYLYGKIKKAKAKKEDYLQQVEFVQTQIQKYYHLFSSQIDKRTLSLNIKNILNNQFSSDDLAEIEEKRKKARNLKIKREEAKKQKRIKEEIANFFSRKAHQIHCRKVYLRLSKSKKWVETSQKAKVPLKIAMRLFDLATKSKESHQKLDIYCLNQEQRKIWDFQLDKIDEKGNATVGCHFLEFTEMKRLYDEIRKEEIGLFNFPS